MCHVEIYQPPSLCYLALSFLVHFIGKFSAKFYLPQGNVFTRVCHSVHRGVGPCMMSLPVWLPAPLFLLGGGIFVPGPMFLPGRSLSRRVLDPGGRSLKEDPPPRIRKAGDTHPTGMLSFFLFETLQVVNYIIVQAMCADNDCSGSLSSLRVCIPCPQ